ncbi:hypothetical protein FHS27_001454 [Rhodopirellula rubra]|uniref:Uncharacterized protein n=1 Tax=Aporhodopirellula rubra TaxID=980271 RepID=A0A7W5DW66_9BACT|nr:hypothetical protein [Aporhodopirellula rubra]
MRSMLRHRFGAIMGWHRRRVTETRYFETLCAMRVSTACSRGWSTLGCFGSSVITNDVAAIARLRGTESWRVKLR